MIKACVRFWQLVMIRVLVNWYPLRSVHSLDVGESVDWDLWCSCDELNQSSKILLGKFLNDFPEPFYCLICRSKARIINVILQILKVNFWKSRNQKLQLFGFKETYAFMRNNFMETFQKLLHLSLEVISHFS